MKNSHEIVIELLSKALKSELGLDELYEAWPEQLAEIPRFERIFDDLESWVEHFPGSVPGKLDWTNSTGYRVLDNHRTVLLSELRNK